MKMSMQLRDLGFSGRCGVGLVTSIAGQIARHNNSTMAAQLIQFAKMAWENIATGAREKRIESPGFTLRLVEFSPGFIEHTWCQKAHLGYIISGNLAIQFRDGTVLYQQGDGICINAGCESEHKAIVTEGVQCFSLSKSAPAICLMRILGVVAELIRFGLLGVSDRFGVQKRIVQKVIPHRSPIP
ncbi:MAG: hypothetical protein KDB27_21175 [Planctomycetales bacterium]|nr:hypothetical protein [Planctomycetales bacterium]